MTDAKKIRVLHIDDDRQDYIIIEGYLEDSPFNNFHIDWTMDYDEALDAISNESYDVYLIDLHLGRWNGFDLIKEGLASGCKKPLILLTGAGEREIDLEAMEIGAADYLVKGEFNEQMLERSILYAIRHWNTLGDLQLALEKERELGELKSRFVSMASHEFRTPLTTILSTASFLEMAEEQISSEKRLARLHKIQTAANEMTELLNDVLLFGKAEADRLEYQPKALDIVAFATEIVEDIHVATGRKHHINFINQMHDPIVTFDDKLMRQVITNLVSNAVKYSPNGGEIRFELTCDNDILSMIVCDEGMGIPEKDQPHLFEPFHRARNVRDISGTGLGLAITKKAVEKHGGDITFESQQNQGTCFTIRIPQSQG